MRRVSVWHIAMFLPALVASLSFHRTFNDNSYLWHVRAGDLQIGRGAVLTEDPFSFTKLGEPWRTQSWLADNLYSWLDGYWGLSITPGVVMVSALLLLAFLGLIAYRSSRSVSTTALFLVLSILLFAGFLNPRPVILSYVAMSALVLAANDRRIGWTVPLLMWVWASVHGSFVIGLGYLALKWVVSPDRRRTVTEPIAAAVASLLTAHGWGVVGVLVAFVSNREAVNLMSEWQVPDLISIPFLPLLLAVFVLIFLGQSGDLRREDWIMLVPFLILALSSQRAAPPAWIALSPIITRVRLPVPERRTFSPVVAWLIAGSVVLLPLLIPAELEVDRDRFPVDAAQSLTTSHVFHDDATGGWLAYTQSPDRQVFIDDRAELYGELISVMIGLRSATDDWEPVFARYGIEEVLLPSELPLVQMLRLQDWNVTFEDEQFVVLRRTDGG